MNKREAIHALIDKLLDLEESSNKRVYFSYYGNSEGFDFSVDPTKFDRTSIGKDRSYFSSTFDGTPQEIFERMSAVIKIVSAIPDQPNEKCHTFTIPESKAKELGLITA